MPALPGVAAGCIGLQGTSLGGFVATTASALDRGDPKTFIMLAGDELLARAAGLPDIHHIRLAADHSSGVLYLPVVLAHVAEQIVAS